MKTRLEKYLSQTKIEVLPMTVLFDNPLEESSHEKYLSTISSREVRPGELKYFIIQNHFDESFRGEKFEVILTKNGGVKFVDLREMNTYSHFVEIYPCTFNIVNCISFCTQTSVFTDTTDYEIMGFGHSFENSEPLLFEFVKSIDPTRANIMYEKAKFAHDALYGNERSKFNEKYTEEQKSEMYREVDELLFEFFVLTTMYVKRKFIEFLENENFSTKKNKPDPKRSPPSKNEKTEEEEEEEDDDDDEEVEVEGEEDDDECEDVDDEKHRILYEFYNPSTVKISKSKSQPWKGDGKILLSFVTLTDGFFGRPKRLREFMKEIVSDRILDLDQYSDQYFGVHVGEEVYRDNRLDVYDLDRGQGQVALLKEQYGICAFLNSSDSDKWGELYRKKESPATFEVVSMKQLIVQLHGEVCENVEVIRKDVGKLKKDVKKIKTKQDTHGLLLQSIAEKLGIDVKSVLKEEEKKKKKKKKKKKGQRK